MKSRTHRSKFRLGLALASVAALVAAACGGDDDSADVAPDPTPATDAPVDEPDEPTTTDDPQADEPDEPTTDDPQADEPDDVSGTLVVALARDPERIDPNFSRHTAADSVRQSIFDSLIFENSDGELVPNLATEFNFPDDQTMDMTLREGVVFHDGQQFDAESVRFSVERLQVESAEEGSPLAPQFDLVDEVEILGPYDVRFHFSEPDGNILYALSRLAIVPAGSDGEQVETAPIGTGPFRFVSYSSDNETVVERNPDYWADSPKGMPLVDTVIFRVIPEATTRAAALTAGDVDIAEELLLDQAELVEAAGMTAMTYSDGRNRVVVMNSILQGPDADGATSEELEAFEALTDVRVRRALNYAIDREVVADVIYAGAAIPLGQPWSPGGFGYDPEVEPYPYDPDRARELLAEAGYPDGLSMQLTAALGAAPSEEIAIIVDNLSDIGVTVSVETIDPAVGNERLLAGDPGMLRYQLWNNAESFLNLMVRTDGRPYTAYSNPDVDALFDQQLVTLDPERRSELLSEITQIIRDDPMGIYLWSSVSTSGWNDQRVSGFSPHTKGWIPVTGVQVSD